MGGAEAHLGLYDELIADVVAMGMEGRTHPDATAVVLYKNSLVLLLPLGIPVLVLHLCDLVAQRHRESLHGGGEPCGIVLRCLHVGLEAVGGLHEALVGAFVAESVHQHVAPKAGVIHSESYFNIFHNS